MPGLRRESSRIPRSMKWTGEPERAAEIAEWARNSALLARWQWSPGQDARVLVAHPYPDSDEWVIVPVGATVERVSPYPPGPGEVPERSEEADWPLVVRAPRE